MQSLKTSPRRRRLLLNRDLNNELTFKLTESSNTILSGGADCDTKVLTEHHFDGQEPIADTRY